MHETKAIIAYLEYPQYNLSLEQFPAVVTSNSRRLTHISVFDIALYPLNL